MRELLLLFFDCRCAVYPGFCFLLKKRSANQLGLAIADSRASNESK